MIKGDSKGERSLRSASPHRNAYKTDFHAIKCSFDGAKSKANGASDPRSESRGRATGTRGNKIKNNIFLQMDGQHQDAGAALTKPDLSKHLCHSRRPLSSSSHKGGSVSSITSQESATSDKASLSEEADIDKATLAEKFSVTRKLFEKGLKEQGSSEKPAIPAKVITRLSGDSNASEERRPTSPNLKSSTTRVREDESRKREEKEQEREKGKSDSDTPTHKSSGATNAGPMSRRLESFMLDSDSDDSNHKVDISADGRHLLASNGLHQPASVSSCFSLKIRSVSASSPSTQDISQQSLALNGSCKTASHTHVSEAHFPNSHVSLQSIPPAKQASLIESESSGRDPSRSPAADLSNLGRHDAFRREASKAGQQTDTEAPAGLPAGGVVRAELVVLQNESSESEGNEEEHLEDDVFEEAGPHKAPSSHLPEEGMSDSKSVQSEEQVMDTESCPRLRETEQKEGTGSLQEHIEEDYSKAHEQQMQKEEEEEDGEGKEKRKVGDVDEGGVDREEGSGEIMKKDAQTQEDMEERKGEEDALGGTVLEGLGEGQEDRTGEDEEDDGVGEERKVNGCAEICGIENAAFVDDRERGLESHREEDEEEEEAEGDEGGEVPEPYEELPGLSDEEDPAPQRKIKFSTAPIKVMFA